eukprot:gene20374-1072_t
MWIGTTAVHRDIQSQGNELMKTVYAIYHNRCRHHHTSPISHLSSGSL